jgi:DNA-binding MarR family transcriptional regulator
MAASSTAREAADRLNSASISLLRHVRREDEASSVTAARLSALAVIVSSGPLTLGELAAAEGIKAPTMTRIVYALEDAGLVVKRWEGRRVRLSATARGRRVLERERRRRTESLAARLEALDSNEVKRLGEAAELIERALRSD